MNAVQIFENAGQSLRVVEIDREPWFVAADVCRALDITDVRQAVERLDDDERGGYTVPTPGGDQAMRVISEPGLYALIFGSRKEEAKAFKRWVTHDVLPSIRKTGTYHAPGSASMIPETPLAMRMTADMLHRLADLREQIEALQSDALRTEQNIAAMRAGEPVAPTVRPMIRGRGLYPQAMDAILAFAESREHVSMDQIFGEFLEGFGRTRNNEMLVSRMLKDRGFRRTKITEGHRRIWVYAR